MLPISFLPLLASRVTSSIFRDGIVDLNAGHMSASIYSSLFCPPSLYCVRCLRDENSYRRLLLPLRRPPATGCGMLASSTRELSTNTSKKLMLASEGLSFQDCFLTKCFNTKNSVHKHQLCRAFPKTTLFFLLTSR